MLELTLELLDVSEQFVEFAERRQLQVDMFLFHPAEGKVVIHARHKGEGTGCPYQVVTFREEAEVVFLSALWKNDLHVLEV